MTEPSHPATPHPAIAGDFLALLASRTGTPPRVEAGAAPVQTQATTVFGFHFVGGVLVAGDRRATAGNLIVTDTVEKVIELDATSLLAIAGVPATAFEIARALQTSFEYYRRSQLQPLSLPARVRALSRALRDNLPLTLQGVGVVAPIFAGLDTSTSPPSPRLYFYDPLGAQFQAADFAASGSGANTIRSILSHRQRFGSPRPTDLSRTEAVRFALELLSTAAEFDTATGGVDPALGRYATLRILGPNGIEAVPETEQPPLPPPRTRGDPTDSP